MSISLGLSGCKRRRRSSGTEKVFKFKSFGENGYPVEFDGTFLENLKRLLECGQWEGTSSSSCCTRGFPTWSFQLEISRNPPVYKLLWVVEESIEVSPCHHCKHCVYVGWGDNLICNKKYHFLLPSKDDDVHQVLLSCVGAQFDELTTTNDKINSVKLQYHCHPLHGVFHANGFGHLLCINGIEVGSELAGFQIMDFWDRLCTGLRARKVSLNDGSRKRGMELRLLYGLAYGGTWFGRWGYKFSRGSFGITPSTYMKALDALRGIPLVLFTQYSAASSACCREIPMILSRYQPFSNHSLVTLGDLFRFMFQLESRVPRGNFMGMANLGGLSDQTSCRWSPKRVEMATRVIVEALKSAEYRWISRQEVRDAARAYIGDTGLLDYVLKSLGNHVVGNFLVRRCLNPVTKVLEYSLEDISKMLPCQELNNYARSNVTRSQLTKDVTCLYKFIFRQVDSVHKQDVASTIPLITRVVLYSKYFIKEYDASNRVDDRIGLNKLKVLCTILLRDDNNNEPSHEQVVSLPMPPYESFTLQEHTTVDELMLIVERTFRELYSGMRSFVAESILNLDAEGKGLSSVFGLVEVGGSIIVEGRLDSNSNSNSTMCEGGGNGVRVVDCSCGAKLDDGERMVACDICQVWQHTRCVCIDEHQQLPPIFLCKSCEQGITLSPPLP